MTRRNILKTLVSKALAERTDVWYQRNNITKNNEMIYLEYKKLKADFEQTEKWELKARKDFKNHHVYELVYEDLVNNTKREVEKVFTFLDMENVKYSKSILKKQNKRELSEIIINYEELKNKFKNTKWSVFFN